MARNANVGKIEIGEDSIIHSAYPHLALTLPLQGGAAYKAGTVLQIGEMATLTAGDLTARSYIALEDIAEESEEALVLALGAVRAEKVLKDDEPLTATEAITLMQKSPLACI
jgi:hypothetical protein